MSSNKPTIKRLILALIVIAQVFFISFLVVQSEREIASAPHIETLGEMSYARIHLPCKFYTDESAAHLGRSIWWNAMTNDNKQEGSSRPRPDEAAIPNSINLADFTNGKVIHLCAIWTRREDRIWDYRLEAPNSVEAQPREGEWRSPALLAVCRDFSEKTEYLLKVDPFAYKDTTLPSTPYYFNRHFFSLSTDDSDTISEWMERHSIDDDQLPCSIIFALREGKSPIAVRAKINGIPIGEALRRMRENSFPISAPTK